MRSLLLLFLCGGFTCGALLATETPDLDLAPTSQVETTFGGDLRLRWVVHNHLPILHREGVGTDFFRVRTRLYGGLSSEKIDLFARLTNEFRYYRSPHSLKGRQRFPDVTFIDNLYVTFKDIGDVADVTLGRQELRFGAGRILSDGTPADGSRSTAFDAARITLKLEEKRALDLFALYMARHDWMPTLGQRHAARSLGQKSFDEEITGYNHNEYGAGLYYRDTTSAALGWEAYYVFKGEEGEHSTVLQEGDTFHTHTLGMRLLPRFTQTLSGEAELSIQFGDDDLFAVQSYLGITYAPQGSLHPQFTLGALYLSGDRSGARGKHAWHSVFNRAVWLGDIIAGMYAVNDHTNLFYPHLAVTLTPSDNQTVRLSTGLLFAPTAESDRDGGTYGHFRGYHLSGRYAYAFGKRFAKETLFERVCIAFSGEMLTKGNAFADDSDHLGLFGQVELTCAF